MAYAKFDDPKTTVDSSARKVYATPTEVFRRALQSISNRVLGGTSGSANSSVVLSYGTGGLAFTVPVDVLINGIAVAVPADIAISLPSGTQGTMSAAKYLVSVGTAGTAVITGPGNVVALADYTTVALANAAAKLPDLPDGHCAIGYMTFDCGSSALVRTSATVLTSHGTQGTAIYTDLFCMPYDG